MMVTYIQHRFRKVKCQLPFITLSGIVLCCVCFQKLNLPKQSNMTERQKSFNNADSAVSTWMDDVI